MTAPTPSRLRPARWQEPFGEDTLDDAEIERVLATALFGDIESQRFPPATPLREILRHDTRIVRRRPGEVVFRRGDYETSAFFVLSGTLRSVLDEQRRDLLDEIRGSAHHERAGWLRALSQLWRNSPIPEQRSEPSSLEDGRVQREGLILKDVSRVLAEHSTAAVREGELFGEQSALGRTPRGSTVFAETEALLLEIRWQGLRDIARRAPTLQRHIDERYRERSLYEQLRQTHFAQHLYDEEIQRIAAQTIFESYGDREWSASFKRLSSQDAAERLQGEPLIAEEGHYPNGLLLIRSGFARVSQRFGNGHRTLSYLGRGQSFGFEEIARNWRSAASTPYRYSLRAVGYVDVLLVPTPVMEEIVLPRLPERRAGPTRVRPRSGRRNEDRLAAELRTEFLEQIVETRTINGTSSMLIDLERCTRCDDCVRACAATHDGNPRFVRHGLALDRFMVANACMHCADPVCMIGCPTGAIHRISLEGQIAIHDATCIGCGTCAQNCPYDNIRMVATRDEHGEVRRDERSHAPVLKATKCDLCVDQLGGPACQNACPHDALSRVDMRETPRLLELLNR